MLFGPGAHGADEPRQVCMRCDEVVKFRTPPRNSTFEAGRWRSDSATQPLGTGRASKLLTCSLAGHSQLGGQPSSRAQTWIAWAKESSHAGCGDSSSATESSRAGTQQLKNKKAGSQYKWRKGSSAKSFIRGALADNGDVQATVANDRQREALLVLAGSAVDEDAGQHGHESNGGAHFPDAEASRRHQRVH